MSLDKFRTLLLKQANPEKTIRLADHYIRQYDELKDEFVLPKEHATVAPAIEYFVGDLAAWVGFVRGIREDLPKGSLQHRGVHNIYRTLYIRITQQDRRTRLDAAVAQAVKKKIIPNNYDVKLRYVKKCTQVWQQRCASYLKAHRIETESGRLSTEEREELLEEFWKGIDTEIKRGELPKL